MMNIIYAESVGSTNEELKRLAAEGMEEGTAFIAGQQTAGRGRLGRSFESKSGLGAWVSVLIRPDKTDELSGLTCAAAVAVKRTVREATGLNCSIKWTNDLVINGKKVCGILTEFVSSGAKTLSYAVIGAGLNINQDKSDFSGGIREKASSLYLESGIKRDCRPIAEAMARSIYTAYKELGEKRELYMDEYRDRCVTLGRTVEFMLNSIKHRGVAEAIDDDGALIIRLENGEMFTLRFGEASVV